MAATKVAPPPDAATLARGLVVPDSAEMQRFGHWLGGLLADRQATAPAWVVSLEGELGTGKTTLARALLQALGHSGPVPSPTYTLAEHYALPEANCWHLDLYRLERPQDLQALGLEEMLAEAGNLLLIEWPDRLPGALPPGDLHVQLQHRPGPGRTLKLQPRSPRAHELLGVG